MSNFISTEGLSDIDIVEKFFAGCSTEWGILQAAAINVIATARERNEWKERAERLHEQACRLEAALREIADDSDSSNNWNPDEDEWNKWTDVDDIHLHGFREGEWCAAKKARAVLVEDDK